MQEYLTVIGTIREGFAILPWHLSSQLYVLVYFTSIYLKIFSLSV